MERSGRARRRLVGRVLTYPPTTPSTETIDLPAFGQRCRLGCVVLCGMPFGGSPPFSDTHLPRALARRRPVLVVDRPLPVHHWRPGQPWGLRRRLVRCGPQLWRLTPLALPGQRPSDERPGRAIR